MSDEHEKRLRGIELSLDAIATAIEQLAIAIEQVTAKDDRGKGVLRVLDIGRD